MKKFVGILLSSFLVLNGCVGVFAEQDNTALLKSAYNNMQKASFESYTYGWEKQSVAQRPKFSDGVLTGKIGDYDNDGAEELLTLKIENSYEVRDYNSPYAVVSLNMYEVKNGAVDRVAETEKIALVDSFTDAGGLEFFTKNGYIALQVVTQNNTFADGATQKIRILSYNGNEFQTKTKLEFTGSSCDFKGYPEVEELKNLGFTGTANYISGNFSPYFDYRWSIKDRADNDYDGLNMAFLEEDTEPIYEVIIKNNRDDLDIGFTMDYATEFVKNEIMTMQFNDFSDINSKIIVVLNGNELEFEQEPYIKNDTTMVAMRKIFEGLGADVEYNPQTKEITATKDGNVVEIAIDSDNAKINGEDYKLAVAVENKNGFAMIPLRFVSEALGAEVAWNGENKTVTINQ